MQEITVKDVLEGYMTGEKSEAVRRFADDLYQEAIRMTMELNSSYHTPAEIIELMSILSGQKVDASFRMFPPFYTDFGKNTVFGKNVFINSGCHFQDQGGITIGDGTLIGHNVVLATINHDLCPRNNRKNHYAPIRIGDNVWIGSNATVLQGVTVGDWAVIGAGAVVTRDVPPMSIVGGVPARVIRYLTDEEKAGCSWLK